MENNVLHAHIYTNTQPHRLITYEKHALYFMCMSILDSYYFAIYNFLSNVLISDIVMNDGLRKGRVSLEKDAILQYNINLQLLNNLLTGEEVIL